MTLTDITHHNWNTCRLSDIHGEFAAVPLIIIILLHVGKTPGSSDWSGLQCGIQGVPTSQWDLRGGTRGGRVCSCAQRPVRPSG